MEDVKLSREDVMHSIRGSLAEDILEHEDAAHHTVHADDIIELTPAMEVKKHVPTFSKKPHAKPADNPFHGSDLGSATLEEVVLKLATPIIENWLDKNLERIVEKAIDDEFKRIHAENE